MNKYILLTAMTVCLLVTACGGGGGGGGSAAAAAPNAIPLAEYSIFAVPAPNKSGDIIERDGNPNDPYDDYVLIERDANGLTFTYRDLANRKYLGNSHSLRSARFTTGTGGPNDFVNTINNTKRAESKTQTTLNHQVNGKNVVGTFTSTDILEMGGKSLNLQFADFGMWKTKSNFTGSIDGQPVNVTAMSEPEDWTIRTRDKNHKATFDKGAGTAEFSGRALGVARAYSGNGDNVAAEKFAEVYGTASMQVDLNTRKADLSVILDNFYRLEFGGLELDKSGEFENGKGSTFNIYDNNNTTGVAFDLGKKIEHDVEGQFFGPSKKNPSEAVGDIELDQIKAIGPDNHVELDLVFGLKKK